MLKYHGHVFLDGGICACCVGDERKVSLDPTGTKALRKALYSQLAIKWRGMQALTRRMIVDQDILSLGSRGLMNIANPAIQGGSTKVQMFQRWFDHLVAAQVLQGDGSYLRDYIRRGYEAGQAFAQSQVGNYTSRLAQDRIETLFQLAVVELQGIIEATSQQAVRSVAAGLLHGSRPAGISRAANAVIDKVGLTRSAALAELIIVKAFGEATLDTYEAAGVRRVGLLPEIKSSRVTDAKVKKITPSGRAGSRSRRGEAPGERTIQRVKKHEKAVERKSGGLVNVETAGDDDVCPVCERIAKRGPYKINRARALIPAHPRCRCVFVPVVTMDRRVRDGGDFDESEHPRASNGQFGSGLSEKSGTAVELGGPINPNSGRKRDPNAHEIQLVDPETGETHYRLELVEERGEFGKSLSKEHFPGRVFGVGYVENVSQKHKGKGEAMYKTAAQYAERHGGSVLAGGNLQGEHSQKTLNKLEKSGHATKFQHGEHTLYKVTSKPHRKATP